MSVYSQQTQPTPYAVAAGDQVAIVNAEQLGAGNFSQRVAIADKAVGIDRPILLTFTYAAVPAAVEYDIFVAWDDNLPGSYTNIGKTTNVAGDQVTINRAAAGGNAFRFVCVKEVVSPGVNATVKVQQ
jgi:hypothetical protein